MLKGPSFVVRKAERSILWYFVARMLLCVAAVTWAFAQTPADPPAGTPPSGPSEFIGSATCRGCHPNVAATFFRNPHFKSVASGAETPERMGCEGCHGPGRTHAESLGKTPIARVFSKMEPELIVETCLGCHGKDLSKANIQRSRHTESSVVCTNCHSIHHSPEPRFLLAKKQPEVCYGCHADIRAQFSMPFKHRVNEGVVKCTDCHNPHGAYAPTWRMGARPQLVDQRLGNEEPCLKCHADKRGPFVYEHAPVRVDGCESCHTPHGSPNAKLLRRPVVFTLCLECHNGAGNFGIGGTGVPLQGSNHNLLNPRFQRCVTCHVRIHGSNVSDHFFR
jgi:DmsE family decaheme c-type cytochrome